MSPEMRSLKQNEEIVGMTDMQPQAAELAHSIDLKGRGRALAAMFLSTVALAGVAKASAEEGTERQGSQETVETTIHVANSQSSAEAVAKAKLTSNHRTVSKAKVNRFERAGRCISVSGQEAVSMGIFTAGTGGFFAENRPSTLCDGNGNGIIDDGDFRGECGNKIQVRRPKPALAKITHWVGKKAKIKIKAVANADAQAECTTANTSAMAVGRARAKAVARLRVKEFIKAKAQGEDIELISELENTALLKARAEASAEAQAQCQETTAPGPTPPPQPPPQPPQNQNSPPEVDLVDKQHSVADRNVEVCAYGRDQNNDIVYQQMTESGDGAWISNIYSGDEAGEFCRMMYTGTSNGTAVVTATVRDSAGNQASDTESWPIVVTQFKEGQGQ